MSYEVLMAVVEWDAFKCRPDCTEECTPDDCLAQRRAVQQYESVVQRVVNTDEELKGKMKCCKGKMKHRKMAVGEAKLLKLIPAKKSSGLPGPSRSAMSPAKKRRAHSQDREVSGK
ncbi:hypothetical protein CDAR_421631, partial [Caerostris darwini]